MKFDLWPVFWIVLLICSLFEAEIRERITGHPITHSGDVK